MILRATVLSGEVLRNNFYDQVTGQPKPGFSVKLKVLDDDTDETYDCQFTGGFAGLEELKQLKRDGATAEQIEDAAQRLEQSLPPKKTELLLDVLKIKGKSSFITLVCRFAQVATPA